MSDSALAWELIEELANLYKLDDASILRLMGYAPTDAQNVTYYLVLRARRLLSRRLQSESTAS